MSIKTLLKRTATGALLAACVAVPLLKPAPAEAWWRGGWGYHAGWGWHGGWGWRTGWYPGWGWRGGVWVGGVAPYYAAPYAYRWVPGYYAPGGYWIAPHWGYR